MKKIFNSLILLSLTTISVSRVDYAVNDLIKDVFIPAQYINPGYEGYLGERMKINLEKRLLTIDIDSILEPFINRPGVQSWAGEYVGKFLHAASLEYENSGNEKLLRRIDYAAKELINTQLADGYLGTYEEKDRWTMWDVWCHKYVLIGLLSYYNATGYTPALEACVKVGDLLCDTFGEDTLDIIKSGTHVGMAPSSVMEPMVELYHFTGNKKYIEFCEYIVKSWEQDHGPKIISSLLEHGNVFKTANGKAYEMLSCLVGLLELYKVTGNKDYLKTVLNAWNDIVNNRLYINGTASHTEHFKDDSNLNPRGQYDFADKYCGPGEGCVTVTWIQMNWHLLQLTGEQKYARQLENSVYNALFAAQSPKTGEISYFLPLVGGRKRYGEVNHGILPDVCCCSFSIPRGIALIPKFIAGSVNDNPALLFYSSGRYEVTRRSGLNKNITLDVITDFPVENKIDIKIGLKKNEKFKLLLNVPAGVENFKARSGDQIYTGIQEDYLIIEKTWKDGDEVEILMEIPFYVVPDNNKGSELAAIKRGPQLLATDENITSANGKPRWGWVGDQVYKITGNNGNEIVNYFLVPLSDAGQTYADYDVLINKISIVEEKVTPALSEYRKQLHEFRNEFGIQEMPDIKFFLFGMANRTKLLYKQGKLIKPLSGEILREWNIKAETIIPNEYKVELETMNNQQFTIYENEKGVYIVDNGKESRVNGTDYEINLPSFSEFRYCEILKVLHQELLINVSDSKPVPNYFVYKKPWIRDASMMAMCFKQTDNLHVMKEWVLNLEDVYDYNNGEAEVDNLGQTLYLLSLFADKNHPLVNKVFEEVKKREIVSETGKYITGRTDGSERPVYGTKWLKFGLSHMGLEDHYIVPDTNDGYNTLIWWMNKDIARENGHISTYYPYISWAQDHYFGRKNNALSNRDYPLTWEIQASAADYPGMAVINEVYVKEKTATPHTWHAAEVFLYLTDPELNSSKDWEFQHQVLPDPLDDPDDIACADINGDGLLDLIVDTDGMAWYENLGGDPPKWKMHHPIDPDYHGNMGIWTGDFDGDGDLDITGGQQGGDGNYWYENTGREINWPVHFIFNMDDISDHSRIFDFNHDGRDDIITQAYHGAGTYYLPSPDDPKKSWQSYKIGGKTAGLAIYDVDQDGDMDVLNSNAWYENPGDPAQNNWPEHVIPNSIPGVKCDAGDINEDGITDFAHSEEEGSSCYVILSPHYTRIDLKTDGKGLHSMKLDDFDRDGDLDLLTGDIHGGQVYIFENTDGAGTLWKTHTFPTWSDQGSHNCWTCDFNNDGMPDVFGKHYETGSRVEIWYNTLK